jgi:outer membrane receptor protein involved in Fe transport
MNKALKGICGSIFAMLLAPAASAAEAVADATPATTEQGHWLEEIVVTAQKRSENLQEVPISITALSSDTLEASVVSGTMDLNAMVPGLNSRSSVGFLQPFIRGVGSTGNGAGIEAPVAMYVDGVYIASAPAALFSFNGVQRIEVLKGPQGTLFGRNATGGLIQVITKDPSDKPELNLRAGYGNYDALDLGIYAAGSLARGIRANLAVRYGQDDGAGRNLATGASAYRVFRDLSTSGKLVFDLGEATTLKLAGDYHTRKDNQAAFRTATDRPTAPPVNVSMIPPRVWDSIANDPNTNDLKGGGASARLEHDFAHVKLMNLAAYRENKLHYQIDADSLPFPVARFDSYLQDWTFTEEFQLQSPDSGPFKWTAGLYYFKNNSQLDPQTFYLFGSPLWTLRAHYPSESYAGYGETTVEIASNTHFTGGLRYTRETRERTSPLIPTLHDSLKSDKLTWRASLDHRFSDATMVYATASTGFKSGGFSGSFIGAPPYDLETITAYEVGLKSEFADNRVRLNGAVFHYDYNNIQVDRVLPDGVMVYNGAKARIWGLDADLTAALSRYFDVSAGVSWIDSKFSEFPNGIGVVPVDSGGYSEVIDQDYSGNRTAGSPKYSATLTGDFRYPTSTGTWGTTATYYYNNGYFLSVDNVFRQPAYNMINLSVRWTSPDEKYAASLWGQNLLNEQILSSKFVAGSNALESYQSPRTFGATLEVKF